MSAAQRPLSIIFSKRPGQLRQLIVRGMTLPQYCVREFFCLPREPIIHANLLISAAVGFLRKYPHGKSKDGAALISCIHRRGNLEPERPHMPHHALYYPQAGMSDPQLLATSGLQLVQKSAPEWRAAIA